MKAMPALRSPGQLSNARISMWSLNNSNKSFISAHTKHRQEVKPSQKYHMMLCRT